MNYTTQVTNEEQTKNIAAHLAKFAKAGYLVILEGQLGAGKTTFTKGFAQGLGIQKVIKSPTYTLIREYKQGRLPLYHMDMYRLEEVGGGDLGLEEYVTGDGVVMMEWATFVEDELPEERLVVKLDRDEENISNRTITLIPHGKEYISWLADFQKDLAGEKNE
ncbi:tRNA threonylcarbamoyladenosine biosynthesis protein TsaE [Granulicatella balaenopterae]|uniref:tRNA threonylcarbamoyladenosine biosynthesis protein TsaE n=1 Tax=Granulicatella balaenopterae TaxID=137733 RepID=A0A1H9JKG2_9LACT|nr:tRNA (adenosine(37)-N6)-threonylcarbamoyltransferase complex ATPase subunit type 1 TsaE [Granulicatella balaenopterae]SEQ87289.1 tRNA threonylcarbamoyladenosine biosynthesis protein TsaE [Granulicatella balaenopterae]